MQIRETAIATPDKPAVVVHPSGAVVTFGEMEARANQLAHYFRNNGLVEGDVVAILIENNEHFHTVSYAARRSGLYYVPINTHLTAAEAAYIVDNSEAKAIVGTAALKDLCAGLAEHLPNGLPQILLYITGGQERSDSGMTLSWRAGPSTRTSSRTCRPPRSPTNSTATCCSTPRVPPDAPRASSASCRTCRPRRCPA